MNDQPSSGLRTRLTGAGLKVAAAMVVSHGDGT
jgi:hypothetical protein